MKIAFFHNLPPGGAKRVLFEEIKYFSKKNDVFVFQIKSHIKDFIALKELKCEIIEYDYEEVTQPNDKSFRPIRDLKLFTSLRHLHKKIAGQIDKMGFDLVIVHPDQLTQAPYVLRYLKTPTIYYCHEVLRIAYDKEFSIPDSISGFKKTYEISFRNILKAEDRKNINKADVILVNSKFTQNNVRDAYSRESSVCYPGVNTNEFRNLNLKREFLLFVGEKSIWNGFDLISDILKKIPELKNSLKIVDLKNPISEKTLINLYNKSIATLCLGKNEPFGLTALESMACETPVIALDEGGYKETVTPRKTGFLIKKNTNDLSKKIHMLEKNSDLVKKLGKQGRRTVIKKFSWQNHCERIMTIFQAEASSKINTKELKTTRL